MAKETRVKSTGRPLELLFRVTSNEDSRFFSLPPSLGTRPTRKRGAAASPLATLIREFFFFHGVFRDVNIVDEDCGPIPGIGTSLTRKKTPISFYSIGNEKPRKAMANDEAPVARDGLAYKEAKRMADARSSRLDSTQLSTLCSHSIKNSPPLSWPSDALAYNVGAFFPFVPPLHFNPTLRSNPIIVFSNAASLLHLLPSPTSTLLDCLHLLFT